MIGLNFVYFVSGLTFAACAFLGLFDNSSGKRFGNFIFWGLLSLSMFAGDSLGDFGNGVLVLGLVAIAGFGLLKGPTISSIGVAQKQESAAKFGNSLFLIALVIPATALLGTFLFKQFPVLFDGKQVTLVSLTLGVIIALIIGFLKLKSPIMVPLEQGRRLIDSVGWAAILPQMLASLGAVFALAGVGGVVGDIANQAIPNGSLIGAIIVYGVGMALFTMIMGNAFAAFPVMFAAIAYPLLIKQFHGDPAVIAAIGMLCGFCGTLMSPMAANFNLVPAVLLELQDKNGVIKAQVATALPYARFKYHFYLLVCFLECWKRF
ncbi:MAG: DUF979 domain-containing protein [Ahrensia sp.]|nr:DUF979 domain-containing protein [Ahrensia sp.]